MYYLKIILFFFSKLKIILLFVSNTSLVKIISEQMLMYSYRQVYRTYPSRSFEVNPVNLYILYDEDNMVQFVVVVVVVLRCSTSKIPCSFRFE